MLISNLPSQSHPAISPITNKEMLLTLPGRLLKDVFKFLPEADRTKFSSTSPKANACYWTVRVLDRSNREKRPQAGLLYHTLVGAKGSKFLLDTHLDDLECIFNTRLVELIKDKYSRGLYLACVVGGRRLYIWGEFHSRREDKEFTRLLELGCQKKMIALFKEGLFAISEKEGMHKIARGLSSDAILKGLESGNMAPRSLQIWSHLISRLSRYSISLAKSKHLLELVKGLLTTPVYSRVLLRALEANMKNQPTDCALAQWIHGMIDWSRVKGAIIMPVLEQIVNSEFKVEKLFEVAKAHPSSVIPFLIPFGAAFIEEPEQFSAEELRALKWYAAKPSPQRASEVESLLIEKRDTDFAENILQAFQFLPPSLPIFAVVGDLHRRGVVLKVSRFYHHHPEKYVYISPEDRERQAEEEEARMFAELEAQNS